MISEEPIWEIPSLKVLVLPRFEREKSCPFTAPRTWETSAMVSTASYKTGVGNHCS